MREAYKEWAGDSGPNWILDLEGPDGNVYNLWVILEQFFELYDWEGDPVEESKTGGNYCLLYTSPSPRDRTRSRMPSSA